MTQNTEQNLGNVAIHNKLSKKDTGKMNNINYEISSSDVEMLDKCPACDTGDEPIWLAIVESNGVAFFATVRCRICGIVYRRIRPRAQWYKDAWSKRNAEQSRDGFSPFNEDIEKSRYDRYAHAAKVLVNNGASGTIIDVGCGPATGIKAYRDAGFATTGLEPDITRSRYVEIDGVSIVEKTIEEYARGYHPIYDSASCIHSLEHFHDPKRVLIQITKLVKHGGLIYIEVPDYEQNATDWNDALTLVHMTNFTESALATLGKRLGLDVVCVVDAPADPPAKRHLAFLFRNPVNVYAESLGSRCSPVRINVPAINDISLCYKADPSSIKNTLHQNFAGRCVDLRDGLYHIKSS